MTKHQIYSLRLLCLASFSAPLPGRAINIEVSKGWPCNVFLNHPGVNDAVGNYAAFNVKPSPSSSAMSSSFVAGEVADYLSTQGLNFDSRVENLPFLEPLSFNLKSEYFGAKLGVDVCIPAVDETREDLVDWDISALGLASLLPSVDGDWFSQGQPKISMTLLATNCNGAKTDPMSTSNPIKSGSCEVTSTPLPGSDFLALGGAPIEFGFKMIASRQAVIRFTVEEVSTAKRRAGWDSGVIQIQMDDPPLPPLLVGDLLGKQLFFIPDSDLVQWPGCTNFNTKAGLAFDTMDLQGPNTSLDLRWKGKDTDCNTSGTCSDGNKRANSFDFPVLVYLENGSLAGPSASVTDKVKNFVGDYDDLSASAESVYPSQGKIVFDAQNDEVYRNSSKAFFSTTISRLIAPSTWRDCRVWFKRDNGFDCTSLPTAKLRNLCAAM